MFIKRKISLLLGMAAVFPLMAHGGNNTAVCFSRSNISATFRNTSLFAGGINYTSPFSVTALESKEDIAKAINNVGLAGVAFEGMSAAHNLSITPDLSYVNESSNLGDAMVKASELSDKLLASVAGEVDSLRKMIGRNVPSDKEKLGQFVADVGGNASSILDAAKIFSTTLGCKNGTNPVTAKLCFHAPKFEAAAQEVIDALKPFAGKDICEAKKPWYKMLFSKGAAGASEQPGQEGINGTDGKANKPNHNPSRKQVAEDPAGRQ
ncbi:MAG: hypothetical protein LBF72_04270 [Holosporales bacterium]|jgi:hypothetical protein|nr:hypothetical protein [Holosporales bacterium]